MHFHVCFQCFKNLFLCLFGSQQEQEREEERKRLGRERREKEREREERKRQRERESNKGAEDITSPDHLLGRDR